MESAEGENFQTLRDILSTPLIEKSTLSTTKKVKKIRAKHGRKTAIKRVNNEGSDANDAEELAEFIDCNNILFSQRSSQNILI